MLRHIRMPTTAIIKLKALRDPIYLREYRVYRLHPISDSGYQAGDHMESNGTLVHTEDSGGLITRVGAHLFHAPGSSSAPGWLPFVEINGWHNSSGNAIAFDNTVVAQNGPKNWGELKVGLQAQVTKQWRMWGHFGFQQGDGGYRSFAGLLGTRYAW
jgi:autotransporter family porin